MSDNESNDDDGNLEEYVCGYCNVDRRFGYKHEIGCENETDDENTESDDHDESNENYLYKDNGEFDEENYERLYGCTENEHYDATYNKIEKQCTRRHSV